MIRDAGPADRAAIEAMLLQQIDGAMFPLVNLRAHGLGDQDFASDHDYATRFWWVGDSSLVALTRGGMLMPLLDSRADLAPLSAALAGLTVRGAIGPATSVRPVLQALGLAGLPTRIDEDEPGMALNLVDLQRPDLHGAVLAPLTANLRPTADSWRAAYHLEVLGTPELEAAPRAAKEIDRYLAADSHRVLLRDGVPVAMTGFNATLPGIVQVGGVYTPPALRGRGHARLAVALHLAEARANGVTRAVLFAASPAAARAYTAIGFQPNGSFALVLFAAPVTVAA